MTPERGSARYLFGAAGVIAATAAVLTAGLAFTGGPGLETDKASTVKDPVAARAAWSDTTASGTLSRALSEAPEGWGANGGQQSGVSAPVPYSCPLPGISPAVSYTQSYNVSGGRVQVTLQSYTAGLGAEAMTLQSSNASVCAGSGSNLYQSGVIAGGRGAEHEVAAVSRGGVRTQVSAFRSGDVLAFVTGSNPETVSRASDVLDKHLASRLAGACLNTGSSVQDGRRSPFSTSGYDPLRRPVEVAIAPVEKPAAPRVQDPVTGKSTGVPRTEIPAPVIVEEPVEQAELPDYPVAPAMPEYMEFPEAPQAPRDKAVTTSDVLVRTADDNGPGCGWKFTGMKAPAFNKDEASAEAARLMADAKTKLEAGAKDWQKQVGDYWVSYAGYKTAAEKYRDYAREVTKVNEAWERIAEQWADYRSRLEEYEEKMAERQSFIDRRDEAETTWKDEVARCERVTEENRVKAEKANKEAAEAALKAAEEAAKKPAQGPDVGPKPVVSPSPSPSVKPEPVEGCPAVKPPILSEKVPDEPQRPSEPAAP